MALRRVAITGSREWPGDPAWREPFYTRLDLQIARLKRGDTFVLRRGTARKGIDAFGGDWVRDRRPKYRAQGIQITEELIKADWTAPCGPECDHGPRRTRDDGTTWCQAAGHRRNPSIVNDPDHPVNAVIACCLNRSPGTLGTIKHCLDHGISIEVLYAFL